MDSRLSLLPYTLPAFLHFSIPYAACTRRTDDSAHHGKRKFHGHKGITCVRVNLLISGQKRVTTVVIHCTLYTIYIYIYVPYTVYREFFVLKFFRVLNFRGV